MSTPFDRIRSIFLKALERPPSDWDAYLDEACAEDADLRSQVELLLHAHEDGSGMLDRAVSYPTVDLPISEGPGTQIGPYKLLQQLGEGGMGVVYMAGQSAPVDRRVALKIIKPGMDTRQVIARFEAEEQALAMMDHPNIAKILDAGTTESGRPYFVMELVKGIPITKYCDQQQLTPKQRLELFIPVCQAVQHAHQKGIIHRDLKPSNVLIALYDDKPVPKVIDFGVAKATSQKLTEKTMFTQYGQIVGTLEYMSPEQANLNQLDIDTRSDIYSLGVLLYELLTGTTPFDRERLRSAALDELLRIIREEEPPKPSLRLSTSESLPSIAANRHIEPKRLSTLVHGELDWIAMKALEKDRTRRYETASKFAEDMQHYLNDEAVAACPPSAVYRFKKFARRNKPVMATTATIAASLVIGIIGTTWQAIRASQERDRAVAAEVAAEEDSKRADGLAKQALREAKRATTAKSQAVAEAERADKGEQIARKNLRMAQIHLAEEQLNNGRYGRAVRLLHAHSTDAEDVQGFAWHHLSARAHEGLIGTLEGHAKLVRTISFSPDGTQLASASLDGTVKIWEPISGREIRTLRGHRGEVRSVAFSNNGALLASGGDDNTAIVWDAATGGEHYRLDQHSRDVVAVAFAPNDQLLATQQADGTILLWDVTSRQLRSTLTYHTEAKGLAPFLRFSPDGELLAADSKGDRLNLWDVKRGTIRRQLSIWEGFKAVDFSPDGQQLATACYRQIVIWEVEAGQKIAASGRLNVFPRTVDFDASGNSLAVGCGDGTLLHCDLTSGYARRMASVGSIMSVAYSPDGSILASAGADGSVKTWDAKLSTDASQRPYEPNSRQTWSLTFSPDGKTLAAEEFGKIRLRDVATHEIIAEFPHGGLGIAISPNGQLLASVGNDGVMLWDIQTQSRILHELDDGHHAHAVAFSPDGRILLAGQGESIKLFDVETRTRVGEMQVGGWIWSLAFSPDGKLLASGGLRGPVKLWDWQKRQELSVLPGHSMGPVVFSPDGTIVACQSFHPNGIKLWNRSTKEVRTIGELPESIVTSQPRLAFFPDGRRIALAGSGRAKIWDVETGEELPMIRSFGHWVFSVAISPDGRTLATGGDDGSVRIWHTTTGRGRATVAPAIDPSPASGERGIFPADQLLSWHCHRAQGLIASGRHDEADAHFRRASDALDRISGITNDKLTAAIVCLSLSDAVQQLGDEASDVQSAFVQRVADERDLVLQQLRGATVEAPELSARLYSKLRLWDEAAADWAQVIDLSEYTRTWDSPRESVCRELAAWPEVFDRVVELRPEEPILWIGRGQYRALRSQWVKAVNDYARAVPSRTIADETFQYAGLLVLSGNVQGYRQFCMELTSQGDEPSDAFTAYVMARTCGIAPESDSQPRRLVDWATKAVEEEQPAWFLHALGLAHFRAGEFDMAVKKLEESNAKGWSELAKAQNWLVLAMAQQRLEHKDEARQWLARAQAAIDQARPQRPDQAVDVAVPDWIGLAVLRREAESLFAQDEVETVEQNENPTGDQSNTEVK